MCGFEVGSFFLHEDFLCFDFYSEESNLISREFEFDTYFGLVIHESHHENRNKMVHNWIEKAERVQDKVHW